ncbi:unnamed protein product [Knipowitschia caucasica]|uniref:Uncharacterized protein n=1 Tax=Knipowitschia caucasica TaxID=637954 RepID=A0AAV2MEI5_KNICA
MHVGRSSLHSQGQVQWQLLVPHQRGEHWQSLRTRGKMSEWRTRILMKSAEVYLSLNAAMEADGRDLR